VNCELSTIARSFLGTLRNGLPLTRDDLTSSYAIVRYNSRTYRSAGVVAVVSGRHNADSELKKFEDSQDSSDRHEGWRYLIDRTNLKAGTDPAEATRHRQAELEARESKAMREEKTPMFPPPLK
jgi:hypothetical protein